MKKVLTFLLTVIIVCAFSGCSFLSKDGYSIAYDIAREPVNLDPQTASDESSLTVLANIFEGLFKVGESGKTENAYAASVEKSNGGLLYTIKIREDGKWENGASVTAADFEFALKRLIAPETKSAAAEKFFSIKNAAQVNSGELPQGSLGVKAVGEYTLEIRLNAPNDNLEYLLSSSYAFPCNEEFFLGTKGKYGLGMNKIMSNSAFKIYAWRSEKSITLSQNENYYDSENVLPQAVKLYFHNADESVERLLNKDVDAAFVPGTQIDKFSKKGYNLQPVQTASIGLALNANRGPYSNTELRRAFAYCFDRSSYAEYVPLFAETAYSIIPNGIMQGEKRFREETANKSPDFLPETALKLSKKGAQELEVPQMLTVTMIVNKDVFPKFAESFSHPSQILQKEISLYINIEELSEKDYNSRLESSDYDIALIELTDNTASSMLSEFTQSGKIHSYPNEEYQELLNEAYLQPSENARLADYIEAERRLLDDAAFIPIAFLTDYFVEGEKVTNIERSERTGNIYFKNAIKK